MVVSHNVILPTEDELTVQEVNLSSSVLRAGAFHLGKTCESQNNEYMLCNSEETDPRKCLEAGKAVTSCAFRFFQELKRTCHDEFSDYANCLNYSGSDMPFSQCRNTQSVYDKCVLDSLDIERPEYGYFTRIKTHSTDRPKPDEEPTVYSDAPPGPPPFSAKDSPPANFASRNII